MDFSKTITFPDPPSKYIQTAKKKVEVKVNKKTGKKTVRLKETTHYLTANVWYSNDLHFSARSKIVNFAKDYLIAWCDDIPKLEKCQVELIYYRTDEGFDIDNKGAFWLKVFLDLLKTPSSKELAKAVKYKTVVKTLNVVPDDNVKYITKVSSEYKKGEHKMVIKITGRTKNEQKSLF